MKDDKANEAVHRALLAPVMFPFDQEAVNHRLVNVETRLRWTMGKWSSPMRTVLAVADMVRQPMPTDRQAARTMGSAEMRLFSEQVKARALWQAKGPSPGLDDALGDEGSDRLGAALDQGRERPLVVPDHPLLDLIR
jgi:hypothetical protein